MKIIDGKKISENILKKIAEKIKKDKLKLKLAVILVGENPVSKIFVREKERACQKVGVKFQLLKFPEGISREKLKNEIKKIIKKSCVNGVVIQLPLPKKFQEQEFLDFIPSKKDIDVLSEGSLGKFYSGSSSVCPPTVSGIREILKKCKATVRGKNIVIIGGGKLIGQPLAIWLIKEEATVTIVNKFTKDISSFTKKADIIISGAGRANLLKGSMVKKGSIVIDAGACYSDKKIKGDVETKSVLKKVNCLAAVPGGLGPLTVAFLLENLIILKSKKRKI